MLKTLLASTALAVMAAASCVVSSAFAGAHTVPSNDPSCPGCSLTTGHLVELKTGDLCMWGELVEDGDNGKLYVISAYDGNYVTKTIEMQKGMDASYWDAAVTPPRWRGDTVTFGHNNT